MDNFVQNIYLQLQTELKQIPEVKNVAVKNPVMVGERVRKSIQELKIHFSTEPFTDTNREISFFKYDKPAIIAEFIYAQEHYTIEANKPLSSQEAQDHYYTKELGFIKRFFDQYRFLYQYFQLDGREFDDIYFRRGKAPAEVTVPVAPDCDPDFSTAGDFIFAKFMAYERLQEFLIDKLNQPGLSPSAIKIADMKWTGEVINMVELIYGLYLTGQINHGNVSLNELVRWAENFFGVKIGVIQRRFAEIQSRKRIASTRFLDQMKESVQQKIDESAA